MMKNPETQFLGGSWSRRGVSSTQFLEGKQAAHGAVRAVQRPRPRDRMNELALFYKLPAGGTPTM